MGSLQFLTCYTVQYASSSCHLPSAVCAWGIFNLSARKHLKRVDCCAQQAMASTRCVILNEVSAVNLPSNHVSSTKYTLASFIPQVREGIVSESSAVHATPVVWCRL